MRKKQEKSVERMIDDEIGAEHLAAIHFHNWEVMHIPRFDPQDEAHPLTERLNEAGQRGWEPFATDEVGMWVKRVKE